jgi:hypothetical protein
MLVVVSVSFVFVGCTDDNDKQQEDKAPYIVRAHFSSTQASVWDPTLNSGAGGIRLTGQVFDLLSITYSRPIFYDKDETGDKKIVLWQNDGTVPTLILNGNFLGDGKQSRRVNLDGTETWNYSVHNIPIIEAGDSVSINHLLKIHDGKGNFVREDNRKAALEFFDNECVNTALRSQRSIRQPNNLNSIYGVLTENNIVSDFARILVITSETTTNVNIAIIDNSCNVVFETSGRNIDTFSWNLTTLTSKCEYGFTDDGELFWNGIPCEFVSDGVYLIIAEAIDDSERISWYSTKIIVNRVSMQQ